MRFLALLALLLSGCSSTKAVHWPWNSRVKEQTRLNAATAPKPTTRAEQILRPDETKEFNPRSANFGSGRTVPTGTTKTNEFYFVDKTRTKSFGTRDYATKEAWGTKSQYATKDAPTKESWFSRLTARTKSYGTREDREANKQTETRALPGGDRTFVAQGRRQAALDKNGTTGQTAGGDRTAGESWSGDLRPMTIQDVKALLNKN
jgi:hypothetical protein